MLWRRLFFGDHEIYHVLNSMFIIAGNEAFPVFIEPKCKDEAWFCS